ncbi:unnamed protein product [Symbiodinium sp. CCMP2592]|nr:unnamed protein product [Symbiodinium sp. CCMP2592]
MDGKYAVPAFLDVKSRDGNLNLVLCVVSSAVAGIGIGLFGCLLSAADHIRRRNGGLHTVRSRFFSWIGMIGSVVFGLASLVGLVFGSVSLATVVRAGSTLPANAIFSQMFGLRPLVRDDVLGTLVTISGIISFTIFQGWSEYQHDQSEFLARMFAPGSIVWMSILFILQALSSCWLYFHRSAKRDSREYAAAARCRAVAATLICSCSSAFMDLAAKGWSSSSKVSADGGGVSFGLASPTFWTALSLNVVFLILMRWSTIYGCRRCDVLIFVPLNTTANIILSVASGMICLSEYKSVKSWPGLCTAGLSMLCGIFMLVTGPAETMAGAGMSCNSWIESPDPTKSQSRPETQTRRTLSPVDLSPATSPASSHDRVIPRERSVLEQSEEDLHSKSSALGFVYLNRIHRRAARARSEIEGCLAENLSDRRDTAGNGLLIGFAVDVGQLLGFTGSRGSVGSRQPSVGRAAEYKQVAVAGATGRLGRFVVSELLAKEDELQVIALTRNVSRAEEFLPVENDRLKVLTWDPAADQAAAEEVVADADVALWCAEGRKGIVALGNAFKAKGQRPSGSARVIMCSSAAITRPTWSAKQKSQMSGAADIPIVRLNPGGLLDEKRAAEQALRDTGASYAVARPTGLKDDWPAGRPVVSQGDVAVGRTSRQDLASMLVQLLDEPDATGKTFEVLTVPGYPKPREGYGQALERLEPDTAADLFDCFDKDTSGALSVQGLSHIADSDSRELHELLVAADINADGVITRTEWDQHVSSWFEGHEGRGVQAILDAASGITEEVLQTKRKKVRSKRQIAAVWDGARSDGEDEIGWFGLPAVASQDLSFKAENRAVPIGQKLEVMVGGSCFLCEVAAYDEELHGVIYIYIELNHWRASWLNSARRGLRFMLFMYFNRKLGKLNMSTSSIVLALELQSTFKMGPKTKISLTP